MKKQLEKLIKEYEERIENCDSQISRYTNEIRSIRKNGADSYFCTVEELANERKIADAKRQCYVQAIADIKSLED